MNMMELYIENLSGEIFTIEVCPSALILEMKEKIEKYHGIPVSKQTLYFNDKELYDERDLEYYDIHQGSNLHLEVEVVEYEYSGSDMVGMNMMDLYIENMYGETFTIEMCHSTIIIEVKEKIEKLRGIPVSKQTLFFNGEELFDGRDLEYYDIHEGSNLRLEVEPEGSDIEAEDSGNEEEDSGSEEEDSKSEEDPKMWVNVQVNSETTKQIRIEVEKSDEIRVLRRQLVSMQDDYGFLLPRYGYFFASEAGALNENYTFEEHNVEPGDTIYVEE